MTTVVSQMTSTFPTPMENRNYDQNLSDLDKLKELSEKLRLTTRRPSVVQWKQIIEYRKSRGQYVTKAQRQNLGQVSENEWRKQAEMKPAETEAAKVLDTKKMTSSDLHRTLFMDNQATPTKVTSQGPLSTTPTPTRRIRRIGRVIPELSEDAERKETSTESVTSEPKVAPSGNGKNVKSDNTMARYRRVSQMLEKLRTDLMIMRIEDNKIARKLLDVRSDLSLVRAQRSWQEHADMIDDVTYELEEEEEMTGLIKACDLPDQRPGSLLSAFSPLRHIGLSRMNLNRRRFSIR